uniref:Uncharacterized protein n=1 Tax=Anguilla anguilla TaxID=7936 RepID=A0A0E9RQX2_ANGAN
MADHTLKTTVLCLWARVLSSGRLAEVDLSLQEDLHTRRFLCMGGGKKKTRWFPFSCH